MRPSDHDPPSGLHDRQRLAASADVLKLRRTLQSTGAVGVAGDSTKRDRALEYLRMSQASLMRIADDELPRFAELCVLRTVPADTTLQVAGKVAKSMWIVVEGELVERTPGERSHVVLQVRRNQTAGLSKILSQAIAALDIVAVQPSEVLEVDIDKVAQLRCVFHPLALLLTEAFLPEAVATLHVLQSRLAQLAALRGRPVPLNGQITETKPDDYPWVPRR